MTRLGDALEAERARRSMRTQEPAAKALRVSQATYSRYKQGGPVPLAKAALIARFLRVSLDDARALVVETHDQPELVEVIHQPTVEERVDAIEQSLEQLKDSIATLQRTPKRTGGQRSQPQPPRQGSRSSAQ